MFLVAWIIAHWKVLFAAAVAIVFFSYRANRISRNAGSEQFVREREDNMKDDALTAEEQRPSAPQSQPTGAGAAAAPPAAPAGDDGSQQRDANEQHEGAGQADQTHVTDEQVDTTLEEITGLFANRNPKHVLHGMSDAVRNVATGVGLGLAGVAAGTYGGAKEGGWKGAAKGLGAGTCGLVGLVGYGLYSGGRQMVRGIGNTPSAINEANKGEAYWDENRQKWVRVNLTQDFETLPHTDDDIMAEAHKAYAKAEKEGTLPSMASPPPSETTAAAATAEAGGTTNTTAAQNTNTANTAAAPQSDGAPAATPADDGCAEPSDYYAFLGVEKTATASEIRKAYTNLALQMHPDKNPNDPNATVKFQNLNKVYSVLSNEDSRAAYDRYGTVDPQNVPEMTSNPMKEMLGATFLEPLVGQLHFFLVFESSVLFTAEMRQELHERRRLRVAKNLVSWLDSGSSGLDAAQLAVRDAVSTPLGPVIVSYVAEQYHLSSRQQLYSSTWAREMDSWYSSWAMSASSLWHWTSTSATTARRAFYDKNLAEEDVLRVLAVANESDVKHIVLQACRLVLYDTSITPEKRRERAVGLERLSEMAMEEVKREVASRKSVAALAASDAQSAAAAEGSQETELETNAKAATPPSS